MGQAKTKELHASADATLRIKVVRQEDNSESEVDVAANETVATFRQRFFMKTLLEQPLLSLSQRFVDVDVTPRASGAACLSCADAWDQGAFQRHERYGHHSDERVYPRGQKWSLYCACRQRGGLLPQQGGNTTCRLVHATPAHGPCS